MDASVDEDGLVDAGIYSKPVKEIVSEISSGGRTILQLIESLQEKLTSTVIDDRIKACDLLSKVLLDLHPSCVKPAESSVLAEFLCCRLQDHFSIHPPTLKSLAILSSYSDLPTGTAEALLTTIFREVHVPSCMQAERAAVYLIFTNLLENCKPEVVKLGGDFLHGVVAAVDGEQDPRNLLKVFELAYNITQSGLDLTNVAEEFFEVVGCYFPIDFEPPTRTSGNRPVITNKQLVNGLRKVIASTALFAPYCIPLMVEKMESDIQSAKIDAMQTLSECLEIYSASDLRSHLRSLWVRVRSEVMYAQSEEIEELGQGVIKDIISVLSKSLYTSKVGSDVGNFVKDMLDDCLPRLTEHLQEKMAWLSAKLLIAGSEASKESCSKIMSSIVPVLIQHLEDNSKLTIAEKRLALEILVNATKAVTCHDFGADLASHPFYEQKARIIEVFCDCVSSREFLLLRTVALAGVAALCNLDLLITPENQVTIVSTIVHCIENETTEKSIMNDVSATAGYLSTKWPDVTIKYIFPVLQRTLSDIFEKDGVDAERCLMFVSSISTHIDVITVTCESIMEQISSADVNEKNAPIIESCLHTLCTIVTQNAASHSCMEYFLERLALPIIRICVKLSLVPTLPEQCCSCCSGEQTFSSQCVTLPIVRRASEILRTICQSLEPGKRTDKLCQNLAEIFIDGRLHCISLANMESIFDPFRFQELPLQTRLISLLTATTCSFDKNIEVGHIDILMEKLFHLCQHTIDQPSYVASAKCLAGLLNKQKEPSATVLDEALKLTEKIFEKATPHDRRISILSLVIWITKALVLRSHPRTMEFTKVLFHLFADEEIGKMAADSFDIILRDTEEVLNTASHANIRLMYRQRFFQVALPTLIKGFQDVEQGGDSRMEVDGDAAAEDLHLSATKANYLTALSHILKFLPNQVLYQHLTSLLPLLVKTLNTQEGPLLVSVLSTLYCLVQEAQSAIEPHVSMLLDHFLRLSGFRGNVDVRMQALKCIGVMTLLPTDIVLPHKKRLLRSMAPTLDDKKRYVRREAAKARTEWFLLGDV